MSTSWVMCLCIATSLLMRMEAADVRSFPPLPSTVENGHDNRLSTSGGRDTIASSSQASDKCSKHDVIFAICTTKIPIPIDFESEEQLNKLNEERLKALKSFVSSVVAGLKVASKTDQIALVNFENSAHAEFYLNSYSNATLLAEAISKVGCHNCTDEEDINLASALETIETAILTKSNGYRPEVSQMIIVVIDRWWTTDSEKTKLLFSQLRNAGAYIIPVGVTDTIDEIELKPFATPTLKGKSQKVLKAENFASLNTLVNKVHKTIETIAC